MIFNLFRRAPAGDSIASLYGTIVAQARAPVFYRAFGVPDTVNGRLEMILLHAVLVFRRLSAGEGPDRALGQAIFDLFCQDMDDNLREMGVGDLAVPRTMRQIGEAFYGRQAAYAAALATADPQALIDALTRNVFDGGAGAGALAPYVREVVRRLDARQAGELRRGDLGFPDPAGVDEDVGAGKGKS
jgi:cytochrome b pre-mRNA-processing protein 3